MIRLLLSFGAVALGALASCSASSTAIPSGTCGSYDAIVATSDYMSSEIGAVSLGGAQTFESGSDLGGDPFLESSAGRFFWIASDRDEIIEVDPDCVRAKQTYRTDDPDHMGTSDPQDVAVAPDGSLWIARLDVSSLLVLNPDASRRSTIDLSSLDAEDGNPNADAIRILDPTQSPGASTNSTGSMTTSRAFVALGILDDNAMLASTRPSKVVEINLVTGTVERVLQLKGRNPFGFMVQEGTALYLADAGNWGELGQTDAGIERVDTGTFTSELLVNETSLGGHAVQVAVTDGCAVAIVAGASPCNPTSLVAFDPTTGAVAKPALLDTAGYDLEGLAWVGRDRALVGDRSTSLETSASCPSSATAVPDGFPIHVFDRSGACMMTEESRPIVVPQPPVAIVSIR